MMEESSSSTGSSCLLGGNKEEACPMRKTETKILNKQTAE